MGAILKYDQEYRKAQTELGFAWGADNSYLMQVYLKSHVSDSTHNNGGKSRPSYSKSSARYTPSGSGPRRDLPEKFDHASGKAICQKFNGRARCQWPTCRYACHDKNHRDVDHKDSTKKRVIPHACDVPSIVSRKLSTWETLLEHDHDKTFIFEGLKHGFAIIDNNIVCDDIPPVECDNHKSATSPDIRDWVEQRILEEVEDAKYEVVTDKPRIVSPLSVVPKPDGDIRLVHDFSRPHSLAVNDYASKDPCTYQTIQDAIGLLQPGWYMAKVDIRWAYRAIGTLKAHHTLAGLKWTFKGDSHPTYLCDQRLPFGSRKSPAIFNRITQAVRRIMSDKGILCTAYLDDFFPLW